MASSLTHADEHASTRLRAVRWTLTDLPGPPRSATPGVVLDLGWTLTRPLLFQLDPERAHRLVLASLARFTGLSQAVLAMEGCVHDSLATQLGPLSLPSPIGLAAGLDKDAEAVETWPSMGFGFIEMGTVTALPQPGNPVPRMFRLVPERGLLNRMGFNNQGSEALAHRLGALRESGDWPSIPVGANIGKSRATPLESAAEDYRTSVLRLHRIVDFLTVNISSPNTPGLRELQQADQLARLLDAVIPTASPCPVFLKLAPELSGEDLGAALDTAIEQGIAGIIATNTTSSRPGTTGRLDEAGGVSGAPLWPLARERIGQVLAHVDGRVPVVGVG
ncbi:MAG: quinone-dependent dihydroorotate dehydrogenase, partial [Myxococcota bacterium]|nr:quinone-dependent dihydroorotate dehydrogenase [Myxococcota bacterium]